MNFYRFFFQPNSILLSVLDDTMRKNSKAIGGSSLNIHYLSDDRGTQVAVSLPGPGSFFEILTWECVQSQKLANNPNGPFLPVDEYQQMVQGSVELDQLVRCVNFRPDRCVPSNLSKDQVVIIDRAIYMLNHVVCRLEGWDAIVRWHKDLLESYCAVARNVYRDFVWTKPESVKIADCMAVSVILSQMQQLAPMLDAIEGC